ncbi:MAG: DUF4232 domain-containing protein [Janthinobacterium lividum]
MKFVLFLALAAVLLLLPANGMAQRKGATGPAGADPSIPMCEANDLSLATDDENGSFNGMSQAGTLLVLRNLSPAACRVPQRPEITFLQGTSVLDIKQEISGAKFMHPGPVLVPVVIVPEAEVTSKLRWVSGEVFDKSICVTPSAIAVAIGNSKQQVAVAAHICGDRAKGITFQATPLVPDPTYNRAAGSVRSR